MNTINTRPTITVTPIREPFAHRNLSQRLLSTHRRQVAITERLMGREVDTLHSNENLARTRAGYSIAVALSVLLLLSLAGNASAKGGSYGSPVHGSHKGHHSASSGGQRDPFRHGTK